MGFGLNVKVEAPKVEAPKVEVPKVDVAAAVKNVTSSATGAVSAAIDSAKSTVNSAADSAKSAVAGAVDSAKSAVDGAVSAATDVVESAKASLATVAGAIAEVAVSFTGAIEDIVLEPHLSLDANSSFKETKFEKGSLWIRIEMAPDEAEACDDTLHLFSKSGIYNECKKVCDSYISSPPDDMAASGGKVISVDVEFPDAPMSEFFSLEVISSGGVAYICFSEILYGDIGKKTI